MKGTCFVSAHISLAKATVMTRLNLKEAKTCNSTIFLEGGALITLMNHPK